jgi:hypothetical protein
MEIAEDRRRHEHENEERMRGMARPGREVTAPSRRIKNNHNSQQLQQSGRLRLTCLIEQDDIEAYLLTFERMMRAYEVL